MFIVGIYGLQSVWWDLRTWWDTGMGLGGTQIALMGRHRGVLCVQNRQQNNTGKQEMPVGVVLTDGHMGHKQGPLNPNKNTQKKKKEREKRNPSRGRKSLERVNGEMKLVGDGNLRPLFFEIGRAHV